MKRITSANPLVLDGGIHAIFHTDRDSIRLKGVMHGMSIVEGAPYSIRSIWVTKGQEDDASDIILTLDGILVYEDGVTTAMTFETVKSFLHL